MPTTQSQRQAMLKMYTSDVCGTGEAFTVTGTPLTWGAVSGASGGSTSYVSNEAHWNEEGATCLDTHRLHGSGDDMDLQIRESCRRAERELPPCSGDSSTYYLRTLSQATP